MEMKKYMLVGALAAAMMQPVILSADIDSAAQIDEKNMKAVRDYIDSKRNISIMDKGGELSIGGDVRFEATNRREKRDGKVITGTGGAANLNSLRSYASTFYGVKASLSFEYKREKSSADILIKASHRAGMDTENYGDFDAMFQKDYDDEKPSSKKLELAKAYFAQELWTDGMHTVDLNVGRQRLYDLFDSRIMFFRKFEGVAFKYRGNLEGIGRTHATVGTTILADRGNHYGHAAELGLAHVLDTPFSVKYAYVDIAKSGSYSDGSNGGDEGSVANSSYNPNYQAFERHFNFKVSQLLGYFDVPAEYSWGQKARLYAAYAFNHKAKKREAFNGRRKNRAWYAGVTYGAIKAPGDYALDVNYQWVQSESVPEVDSGGLAIGLNVTNQTTALNPAAGFNNYKGVVMNGSYLATNDIMLTLKLASTTAEDRDFANSMGGFDGSGHSYNIAQIEAIYSF